MSTAGHRLMRTGQIALTVLMLGVVWRVAGGAEALDALISARPGWLVAGFAALTAQTLLSAVRWRLTASQLGLHLSLGLAIREYYLSQLVNQSLPGGVLGDAARAVRSRDQRGLLAAGQAVLFERLAGQIALFAILTFAFCATYFAPGGFVWTSWAITLALTIIGAGLGGAAVFALIVFLPTFLSEKVQAFAKDMTHALAARPVILAQTTLSFATALCNLAAFAFCARSIGVVLSPAAIFALVPLVLFAMLVPLTITGWGAREGAAVALLPLAGVLSGDAFAASVLFGLTMLAATLPGVVVLWTSRKSEGIIP